jgi:hypothetical protein
VRGKCQILDFLFIASLMISQCPTSFISSLYVLP